MRKLLSYAVLLAPAFLHAQETDFAAVQITVNDVVPGIYALEGEGGNIGVSIGEEGVFIIDDQFAELSDKIKAAIAGLSPAPVKYVFNTHFHFDHTGGNENFGADGAVIVAHDNTRARMASAQTIPVFNQVQPASAPIGLPQITFSEAMTLRFNGNTVNAYYFGSAHTDTDAVYHFVEANVIHTGDVFVRYGLPFVDVVNGGNVNGMIRNLHAILALANDTTKIIPGHGELATKADMLAYVDMLEAVRYRVWDGIQQGMTLEALVASDPTRDFVNAGPIDGATFTKLVYDSFFK